MRGFFHNLTWPEFLGVAVAPRPSMMAMTEASWRSTPWSVHVVDDEYRVRSAHVTVALSRHGTWAVPAARANAALLQHEQGHYDITALIARDWICKVLDLSLSVDFVAVLKGSGSTAKDHLHYVSRHFQAEIGTFTNDADNLMARLQGDPAAGRDGLYDADTNHGQNPARQREWNNVLQVIKNGEAGFELSLWARGLIK
jgi:hypothetical protein